MFWSRSRMRLTTRKIATAATTTATPETIHAMTALLRRGGKSKATVGCTTGCVPVWTPVWMPGQLGKPLTSPLPLGLIDVEPVSGAAVVGEPSAR